MIKEVFFERSGKPLYARISSGYAQPGHYLYRLWEAGKNIIVDKKEGNFLNPMDDIYSLPIPNDLNDDRVVQFVTTLTITPPVDDFSVKIEILQGDIIIGEDECSGKGKYCVTINLFVILKSK